MTEADRPSRLPLVLAGLLPLAVVGGGLAVALWPRPSDDEPLAGTTAGDDTGVSRSQTEERMRAIGYVQ